MIRYVIQIALMLALFVAEIIFGTVNLPAGEVLSILMGDNSIPDAHRIIVLDSRLPRAIAALIGGSALALSGTLMQTLFRNPLAGPSVLGISSGASLGVALAVMATGSTLHGIAGIASITFFALCGAWAVLLLILFVARKLSDNTTLLIFGIMLSFFTSAVVDALQFKASNEALRNYVSWGFGSFAECNYLELLIMAAFAVAGILISLSILPRLNIWLLGEDYARSMGISTRHTKILLIFIAGSLTGIVTAFCGPIAFIGLAVPHIARLWLGTSDHRKIMLHIIMLGASMAMVCDLVARLTSLPLNTIASALGAPLVLWIIFRGNKKGSFI